MTRHATLRAAVLGAVAAGAILAGTGRLLGWTFGSGVLLGAGVVEGAAVAVVCAASVEFTAWAGPSTGAAIGVLLGTAAAALAGLLPWVAGYYGLVYLPAAPPLGVHDPWWPLAAIVAAGAIAGAVAGASYGTPARSRRREPSIAFREVFRRRA